MHSIKPLIVIPARYNSTRFPGKPLALINGKPMIVHVIKRCVLSFGYDAVFVATDNIEIYDLAVDTGVNAIMTPKNGVLTGSDRVAFAASSVDYQWDYVINVQGDEPLVNHNDISDLLGYMVHHNLSIVNCYSDVDSDTAYLNRCIKVVTNECYEDMGERLDKLIYMSREKTPSTCETYKKQIGLYGFKRFPFLDYYGPGRAKNKIEASEDIEILRFLNTKHYNSIHMLKIRSEHQYQSVDLPADIKKVEAILNDEQK